MAHLGEVLHNRSPDSHRFAGSDRRVRPAPKHMAIPLGWQNYFGFVCTPRHRTYQNIQREGVFTVTFPRPTQLVLTSLSAAPRDDDDVKPALALLPTRPARAIAGVFLDDGYLFLECRLERVIDGFGENSLIAGRVVAAEVAENAMRLADGDDSEVLKSSPLLAYLAPGRYAEIRQGYAFPYPAGFTR